MGLNREYSIGSDKEAAGVDVKRIRQDMLDDGTNGLDERLVGSTAVQASGDVFIHLGEHEDSQSGEVVIRVAGLIGIPGKLCCNPSHAVIDEDRLEDGHVVRDNVLIHAKCSVNEEVEEDVTISGLVCLHFLDKGGVEGAEVPWVILDMWGMRLFRDG